MITSPRTHMLAALSAIIAGAVGTALIASFLGPAAERIVTVFFISLIGVVGIGIYSGNSGILSFGHVAFMAIGAYVSALLTLPSQLKIATLPNLPEWLATTEMGLLPATAIAMAVTGLVALLVGAAIGRLEGSAATISTLGLLIIVHGVIIGWRDVTRGAQSFFGVPRETGIWTAVAGVIVALVLARLYRDSISGLRLRAGRENAIAASAVGINIPRERLISFVLAGMTMALAGALLAHFLGAFSPKKFYFNDTFLLLAMLIVGGMSTITGAVTGAVIITLVTEVLRRLESGLSIGRHRTSRGFRHNTDRHRADHSARHVPQARRPCRIKRMGRKTLSARCRWQRCARHAQSTRLHAACCKGHDHAVWRTGRGQQCVADLAARRNPRPDRP